MPQDKSVERSCLNCKWHGWSGPHLGCYYNGEWMSWISQPIAKSMSACEHPKYSFLKEWGVKWEPK